MEKRQVTGASADADQALPPSAPEPSGLRPSGNDPSRVGPLPDAYHLREIPGHDWKTCQGCPAFRVFDFHYFYCRHLGDQSKPDVWNAGWFRLGGMTWNEERPAPCDRDRSGEADETRNAAQPEARARAEGIAQPESSQ